MKKRFFWITIVILILLFSPPLATLRSLAVMIPYSYYHKNNSVQREKGFDVFIPGGLSTKQPDWYPFVMTFNDNYGFRKYTGDENASLTIMYNFPAFSLLRGCSRLFDPSSPYLGAFYGAYITGSDDSSSDPYGFESGFPDVDEISSIPEFDLEYLVLKPFGLDDKNMVFEKNIVSSQDGINYAGYDNWSRFDVKIRVNSPCHNPSHFDQSYLQYGIPSFTITEEFAPIDMYGRIYAKYFENSSSGVIFYILSADPSVIEDCDRYILSKSVISGDI